MIHKHLVIPDYLHALIKAKAAENHITMTQMLRDMFVEKLLFKGLTDAKED